ncbi:MAG: helix-turn-helix domain-containing protein [Planctomycetes bacterium]|nr:helix-turn-helix domain-containing protein [Planctomycetota bacterium]
MVAINDRCRIETRDGHRVVSVSGLTLAHYAVGDRMAEAYAMVSLVEQGWSSQIEVAAAFGVDVRTVRRNQRRFESGGLVALGRSAGYPKGVPRLPRSRGEQVSRWKAEGLSNREIASRLGVSEMAARKQLKRLGWRPAQSQQELFAGGCEDANPNLSGAECTTTSSAGCEAERPAASSAPDANPNLSGTEPGDQELLPVSLDHDPGDRTVDRVLACLGLLDDAAPLFGTATQVPGAGWLLAIPALVASEVFSIAQKIYGSIGPAFYGMRTTLLTLLAMALLRIKRPEGLKEHSPGALGRLLGLDRAPEVKTLRRKLARLAAAGRAAEFGQELARHRVRTRGHATGFLYVDGHVRAYHGKYHLPKAHLARMRLAMPATTDYWINDAEGEPLFVVTAEGERGARTGPAGHPRRGPRTDR